MRDEGHPVFEDEAGQWWGERLAERYWTRREARRAAFEHHKRGFRTRELYRELLRRAGGTPVEVGLMPAPRVGLAGESGWYDRPDSPASDGRVPWWAWALLAFAGLVLPAGLIVVDLVVPAADGWALLAGAPGAMAGVAAASWVLRRASGGGR